FAVTIGCSPNVYPPDVEPRAASHYCTLLESALATPDKPFQDLRLLNDDERGLLAAWNDTETPYPEKAVHEIFEQQSASSPNTVPIVLGDRSLTYGELNAQANRVAHHLLSSGAGDRVGVAIERSLEMVIAILGVLKAGAAYVPLDPRYPQERLRVMAS